MLNIKLEPYKLFKEKNEYYLFTAKFNKLYKINEEMYTILNKFEDNYEIILTEDSPYLKLIKENLSYEDNSLNVTDNFDIQSIVLMIIQDCNLNCKYCYGDGGEFKEKGIMSIDTAKQAINYLTEHCGNRKNISVAFFGGEPLLNFEVIKKTIEYMEIVSKNKGIKFYKSITTNATLLTDEIKKFLLDNNINIKISIDGFKEVHDNMRIFPDGQGSYDNVIKNTEDIRRMKKAVARATITPFCLNTKEIEEFLYKIGFSDVGIAYAEEYLMENDYKKIYEIESIYFDEVEELIHLGKYADIKQKYSKVIAYLSHLHSSVMGHYPCGAGRTFYAVDKDGFLYPCQRFVGIPQFQLGSIYSEKNKRTEFLEKMHLNSHIKCKKCWCKNICIGKCAYSNYIKTNKIEEPYEPGCELTRKLYEKAVRLYSSLNEEEKKLLFFNPS